MVTELIEGAPSLEEALPLYESVGWTAYTREPERLARALANSTYVVTARDGDRLVGLARVLSDDARIWYLQDLLVDPQVQGQGLGRRLLAACRARFRHTGQGVWLSDADSPASAFYARCGIERIQDRKLDGWIDLTPPPGKA
jgi:GNAT superfamily N-acetyltransferase